MEGHPLMFEIEIPTDFSTATAEQLDELERVASTAAKPLAEKFRNGETLTEDELAGLVKLGDAVKGVRDQRTKNVERATAEAVKGKQAKAAADLFGETDEADKKDGATGGETGEAKKVGVAQVASAGDGKQDTGSGVEDAKGEHYTTMIAASGALGTPAGTEFADLDAAAEALEARMATYSGQGYHRDPVIMWKRNYPADQRVEASDNAETIRQKMDAASEQSRLPGGALTAAAAGWCAPSQILYDLFGPLENATYGMVDLPELQISRGGIQFTPGPDFSSIWGGAGYWTFTETQVKAAALPSTNIKPTMLVPCPAFTEKRLDVEGVQVTGQFLQDRGYPEMVKRFMSGAMVAHARRLNMYKINAVVAGSTAIDYVTAFGTGGSAVDTTEAKDNTALSRLLTVYGTQGVDYRAKYRMAPDALLEGQLPSWLIEVFAQETQRRWGLSLGDAFTFSLAQANRYFANKNIRIQWVYDWQDAYNTTAGTNSTTVGSSGAALLTLPRVVWGTLYAPGTWVAGVSDVVRLDTVYDSTNLSLNQYTKLFSEEGILVAKRGYESRLIKTPIDPSGTVSATTDMQDTVA